jgi:hypothetical protein
MMIGQALGSGGTLHISRDGRDDYPLYKFRVYIDDVQVATLRARRVVDIPVPPGTHRVQLRVAPQLSLLGVRNSETLPVLVEPHQVVRFRGEYIMEKSSWPKVTLQRLESLEDPPTSSETGAADTRVMEVTETRRIEESLGEDVRLIDNRASPAPVTRTLKASREWTRTLTLGGSHRQTVHGDVTASLLWLSAKGSIEAELQRTLSLAIGSTHLFEEEISVTVPERAAVRIVLSWKRIWQRGEARVLLPDGSVHIVPYQVVVSVTFDQKMQDVTDFPD